MIKNPPANVGDAGLIPGWGRSLGGGKWQPTPVFLPGKFHEQRSLAGYSPWGLKELDRIELLSTEHTCTIRIKLYETHCAKYAHDVASSSTMFTEYVNTL